MPAGSGATTADRPPPVIAIVVALATERACVEDWIGDDCAATLVLEQSGPGPANAAGAARAAVRSGAAALLSFGLAGGLVPGLEPGTVVIPERIILATGGTLETDPAWRERIEAALGPGLASDRGALLTVDSPLATPARKAAAAEATGAVAVDMESGAIAAVAADAGLPAMAVRVVADGAADSLPPGVERWIDATGRRRAAPIASAALRPSRWSVLARLARRHRVAQRALTRVARQLTSTSFEFAPRP